MNKIWSIREGERLGRGNDAIPSWSGFNYQGKMMLLCTIEKMNILIANGKELELDNHKVELERKEDYAFMDLGNYTAFYQVKASISKYKWSQHKDALKKLLSHRDDSGNQSAKCYFVVAKEFTDWTDLNNPYKSSIELYNYNKKIVDVIEVKKNIIMEIEKLLSNRKIKALNIDAVYGGLCIFLDDKIAEMHKQKCRSREYVISFQEIFNVIINSVNIQEANAKYALREHVFEYMNQTVNSVICDICKNKCKTDFGKCTRQCAAKYAAEQIIGLSNIRDYCKLINPEKECEWNKELQYIEHFTKEAVEKYILSVFAESENPALVKVNGNVVGMKFANNFITKGLIIPTMVKFEDSFKKIEDSMQYKLQVIKNNNNIYDLYGNSIIVDSCDRLTGTTLSQEQITVAWSKVNEESIKAIDDDIGFISYKELLMKFKNEDDNYE